MNNARSRCRPETLLRRGGPCPRHLGHAVRALLCVLILGCTRPAIDVERLAREELGAPHGALIIFTPSTCSVDAQVFASLNTLDARPSARVVGLVGETDTSLTSMSALARDFGIRFVLRPLQPDRRALLQRLALAGQPVLLVVRRGRLRAIEFLGESRASDLGYVLGSDGVRTTSP